MKINYTHFLDIVFHTVINSISPKSGKVCLREIIIFVVSEQSFVRCVILQFPCVAIQTFSQLQK